MLCNLYGYVNWWMRRQTVVFLIDLDNVKVYLWGRYTNCDSHILNFFPSLSDVWPTTLHRTSQTCIKTSKSSRVHTGYTTTAARINALSGGFGNTPFAPSICHLFFMNACRPMRRTIWSTIANLHHFCLRDETIGPVTSAPTFGHLSGVWQRQYLHSQLPPSDQPHTSSIYWPCQRKKFHGARRCQGCQTSDPNIIWIVLASESPSKCICVVIVVLIAGKEEPKFTNKNNRNGKNSPQMEAQLGEPTEEKQSLLWFWKPNWQAEVHCSSVFSV